MKGFVVDVRESTARVSRDLRLHMASRKDSAMRGERRVRSKREEIGRGERVQRNQEAPRTHRQNG